MDLPVPLMFPQKPAVYLGAIVRGLPGWLAAAAGWLLVAGLLAGRTAKVRDGLI